MASLQVRLQPTTEDELRFVLAAEQHEDNAPQCNCHRLWLDVVLTNTRAIALYKSEGFVQEGTIRDGYKTATGYESMALMSILETEYFTFANRLK